MKLSFAYDVVCGMMYLHSLMPPVIHSDLRPQNVLIGEKFVAKVSLCYHLWFYYFRLYVIFTTRAYARAVLGVVILSIHLSVRLSVHPSVHLSVTCVDCDKTK